jgi:cobalamin biosynthesis Mg chelatase CobN
MTDENPTRRSLRSQSGEPARKPPPPPAPTADDATRQVPKVSLAKVKAPAKPASTSSGSKATTTKATTGKAGAGTKGAATSSGKAGKAAGEKLPKRPIRWWRGLAIFVLVAAIFFAVGAAVGLYLFGR